MKFKKRSNALLASALAAVTLGLAGSAVAVSGDDADSAKASRYLPERNSKETIAIRQRFFGIDNVNPVTGAVRTDRAIMSWMGVSTFAASFKGHVFMMDDYLAYGRSGTWGSNKDYLGFGFEDFAAINPEFALVGHGHGDHIGHIVQILEILPSLQMYGMEEHCNDIRAKMAPATVNCTSILPAGSQFGSQATIPGELLPGIEVRAVKHPHSAGPQDKVNDPPFSTEQAVQRPCISYSQYPPTGTEPVTFGGPSSGVLSFFWQFKWKDADFALGWSDTTGDESGNRVVPGLGTGAEVPPVVATWPHTNVYFGSIAVSPRRIFNQQAMSVQPDLFIPIHHDPCAFDVKVELDNQIKTLPEALRPQVWYISDPGDYGRPLVFNPYAKGWSFGYR